MSSRGLVGPGQRSAGGCPTILDPARECPEYVRTMLLAEVRLLRRDGVMKASADLQPELAVLLDSWRGRDPGQSFPTQVEGLIRAALAPYRQNELAQIALEVLCLHPTTKGLKQADSRKLAAKRVRQLAATSNVVDAFSKNEELKALGLLATAIQELVGDRPPGLAAGDTGLPTELTQALTEAGVSRFFSSREDYRRYRDSRDTIGKYVSLAVTSIEMVSINLASGHDMEQVADTFEAAIMRPAPVLVRISLLDPNRSYLIESIAPVLDVSSESLIARIRDTINSLAEVRAERLPRQRRQYLEVWCHKVLPNASAILLDADAKDGRVQLETKGFRTGMGKSWGFEVRAGTGFFDTLRDSYRHLIDDGRQVL